MPGFEGRLYESLRQAGLPDVPESFSIAVVHQEISRAIVTEIERFIRVFESHNDATRLARGRDGHGPPDRARQALRSVLLQRIGIFISRPSVPNGGSSSSATTTARDCCSRPC